MDDGGKGDSLSTEVEQGLDAELNDLDSVETQKSSDHTTSLPSAC